MMVVDDDRTFRERSLRRWRFGRSRLGGAFSGWDRFQTLGRGTGTGTWRISQGSHRDRCPCAADPECVPGDGGSDHGNRLDEITTTCETTVSELIHGEIRELYPFHRYVRVSPGIGRGSQRRYP